MTEPISLEGVHACAAASGLVGESPIGWAIGGFRFLLVEVPLPWPARIKEARHLPPGLRSVLDSSRPWDPAFEAIAPEPAWSGPGLTRVVFLDRTGPLRAGFTRREFLVPAGEVADLVRAWRDGTDVGPGQADVTSVRDILVCAHGAHDGCCGRLGIPAFRSLTERAEPGLRVWRASHTGGHRFAPTLLDLPDGRSWGRIRPEAAEAILHRSGEPAALRERYRGLGTLASFQERLVEAELLFEQGWGWTDQLVTGSVVSGPAEVYADEIDAPFDPTVVRITATDPATLARRTFEGVVKRGERDYVTRGECRDENWDLPSFSVTSLRLAAKDTVAS